MFTGIIENTGFIKNLELSQRGGRLAISTEKKFKKIALGESIAVNGCCLTVVTAKGHVLAFDVSVETIQKTALGTYKKGMLVNLERALRLKDRLNGHFVLGHVDGVGKIRSIKKNAESVFYGVSYPREFAHLLVEKGSVALDGISLTVCQLQSDSFEVCVIPHTLKQTNLQQLKVGAKVNLEFDVLGKYVHGDRNILKYEQKK